MDIVGLAEALLILGLQWVVLPSNVTYFSL